MIINGKALLEAAPIFDMAFGKMVAPGGTSYGLGEAGYDIRIKQEILFREGDDGRYVLADTVYRKGRFALASAIERFKMPANLVGVVHDKSTWARRGLSVFNTVIEPGWNGYLTLELVYHGEGELIIPAGAGIAQVLFSETEEHRRYEGKYQHQADMPVAAIDSQEHHHGS
jgi:dCTP deaminase